MIFMAFFYFTGKCRLALAGICMAIAGPAILTALPIWLLGSLLFVAMAKRGVLKPLHGWLLWGGSFAIGLACAGPGVHDYLVQAFPDIRRHAKWAVNFWPEGYLFGLLVAANIYGYAVIGDKVHVLIDKVLP